MKLGLYYIDLNKRLGEDFSEYDFDENGVPLSKYYRKDNWRHNPITVCNYSLYQFNNYIRKSSDESRGIFFAQADWLLENGKKGVNNSLVWRYLFDVPLLKIKAPWISGMAQGQALSVLLRAHQISGQKKYLNAAKSAWNIFNVEVEFGGVISKFPDGKPVIEEYPTVSQASCVLNGFIYAILGVYEYSIYTEEKSAKEKFANFVDSLMSNVFRFDCGYWSYYDQAPHRRLASKSYHQIHIIQLQELFKITKENVFKEFADRWQDYFYSPKSNFKWFFKKMYQKLVMGI